MEEIELNATPQTKKIVINAINVGGPKGEDGSGGGGGGSLKPATKTTLGGIKVGDGLSITTDGTLSNPSAEVPDAPTADGNYVLKVTVSGGTPTYTWVAE